MDAIKAAPGCNPERGERKAHECADSTPQPSGSLGGCTADAARALIRAGFALVAVPSGSKAPTHKGWNSRARAWTKPEDVPRTYRGNVGILHAYSEPPTLALDVDNYLAAHEALAREGIDLDALMAAPDAVQIRSGTEGRAKLIYQLPDCVAPIPSVDRTDAGDGFELRCGTADGRSVHDLAPPSIHPSGRAYAWAGSGHYSRLPECPRALLDLARRLHAQPVTSINGSDTAHVTTPEGRHADMLKLAANAVRTAKRLGGSIESATAMVRAERDRGRWPGRHIDDGEIERAVRGAWQKFDAPPEREPEPPPHPDDDTRADAAAERRRTVSDYVPKQTAQHPRVNRLADVVDKTFAPVRWAVADLIPEGVVLLVGAPKLGKSWLALQCGIAISSGLPLWFGRRPELVGDVLMLALEDNDRRMVTRARKLRTHESDVSRLHYATEWPRADRGGIEALAEWLDAHPDCRLVVIDTLARWRGDAKRSDSAYTVDYEVGAQLKPLADRYHVAIVLVHHTRKAASADVLDSASGTLGLTGSVDAALMLRRERGAMDAALYVTGRDIEREEDYALRFDPATCLWSGLGSVHDAQITRERREILDFLELNPLSRPKQIAEGIGKNQGAVRYLLHKMRANAEVLEIGGAYSSPNTPTNTPISANGASGTSADSGVSAVSTEIPPCPRCDGEGCGYCDGATR